MQDDSSVATYGGVVPNSSDEVAQQLFEGPLASGGSKGHIRSSSTSSALPPVPQFPPPKTDKPRPHVCTTCMRSFARLEHLKRHERSHTKEKPFACSECTRCFARRDLLLRHQQKLHSSSTPSARPRNGRRESVAGGGTGRVRKNSVASNATSMRPRANTLSHVDAATIGMLANTNPSFSRHFMAGHGHHNSMSGLHASHGYPYRGMSTTTHGSYMGLPKLETHGLPMDFSGGLRTAPPFGGFGVDIGMGYSSHQGNTINPHALHMDGLGIDQSDYANMLYANGQPPLTDEEGNFEWMTHGFEHQMNFGQSNDNAIDDSSPSAMSTNSPAGPHDSVGDMHSASVQQQQQHHHHLHNGANWSHQIANSNHMINSPMSMDLSSNFTDMVNGPTSTVSPKSLLAQGGAGFDMNLPTPPDMGSMEVSGINYQPFPLPYNAHGGASTASTASGDSSLRQSSVTTNSSDIVNEGVRTMLLAGLSQNAPFGHRKQSQPLVSSPLSPDTASKTRGFNLASFPSTQDLRKYVNAYIRYFHPHFPFLHIPTLNFESPEYNGLGRGPHGQTHIGLPSVTTGGSCLVLSIAAIGAVYEGDMNESKELFECAKRLISNFLEERRRANLNRTQYGPRTPTDYEDTPLWLVQAMLLNVCYGHNCGDKTAAELASNHCAALVSLARGAELARPYQPYLARRASNQHQQFSNGDSNSWTTMIHENEEIDWFEWKIMEERKRTLYAVFILSSMLVTAYNHTPALTNSEIRLDLPCDEELWAAPSSQAWLAMGGAQLADSKTTTFATALTHLLMSSHRQRRSSSMDGQQQPESPESDLRPSAFGCLVLVNALHNYIWETRQRHLGRSWTAQETEQMHQHIEPALRAWQAAWASDPSHSLERPNPFGAGPLSADSIPLLDLAYVRLYLNLGRAKEAFWQRDFDAMAEELAKGPDTGVAASNHPSGVPDKLPSPIPESHKTGASDDLGAEDTTEQGASHSQPSKHERQLRRAAFYAADSLLMSEKLDLSYSESTSKELPAQSAMCAFDCAQVLAAWVTTVQERIGKYLGVLGKDEMDLMQVPGILLLEDEDRQLLEKIEEFLSRTQERLGSKGSVESLRESGYGARLLVLTAHLLESAAVWPVTKLMARSLETQATHMKDRALASVVTAQ